MVYVIPCTKLLVDFPLLNRLPECKLYFFPTKLLGYFLLIFIILQMYFGGDLAQSSQILRSLLGAP